jgi:hypothetical protein
MAMMKLVRIAMQGDREQLFITARSEKKQITMERQAAII